MSVERTYWPSWAEGIMAALTTAGGVWGAASRVVLGMVVWTSLVTAPVASAATAPVVVDEVPVTAVDERVELGNNSPTVLAHPHDARMLVLASRVDHPDFSCALHVSGDGGRSWLPVNPVPTLPEGAEKCYAPEVAFDRDGLLYYLFVGLQGGGNSPMGAFLVTSADRGRTFSAPRRVLGPERYMVRLGIHAGSATKGRLHLVWLEALSDPPLGGLPPPPNPIMSASSEDGGATWSGPVQVSDPARRRVVAPAIAVAPDGSVRVAYYDLEDDARDYQGLEGPTWEGTWSVVVSASVDGGRTFGPGVAVDEDVVPTERVMLIFTMPPPALMAGAEGLVLVAWPDGRNVDWDVLLRRSTDGGATWSQPRRLNDDEVGNRRHQYLPRLALAPGGRVDAVFYDRRADPENLRNHVMLASSPDGGRTFAPNRRLSSDPSHSEVGPRYLVPSAEGLVEFGSRLGLVSTDATTLAAWADTRNSDIDTAQQDIFATRVEHSAPAREGGGRTARLLVAGAVVVAVAAVAATVLRRRRHGISRAAGGEDAVSGS